MMTGNDVRQVDDLRPITIATDARTVALGAYDRLFDLLDALSPAEWEARTECPAWNVADMVGHLIGAARANASLRELLRQQLWGLRHKGEFGGNDLDAMNALQVRDAAHLAPEERVATLRALAPAAVAGRMRVGRLLGPVRIPLSQAGSTAAGMPRSLSVAQAMSVIYTRDVWLHRVDIARATGRTPDVDSDIDRRIVEDVVAEWAGRHRQPVELILRGPAGGRFQRGAGGERIELDAVEFCRALSGRVGGDGLLATGVLF